MLDSIEKITEEIRRDPENEAFERAGQRPLFSAPSESRILIVGQAPGAKAMEKGVYWDDRSGDRLREFMGVDRDFFYHSGKLAIVPMDFYLREAMNRMGKLACPSGECRDIEQGGEIRPARFTGKGKSGDLPPRKGFAEKWHERILALCPDIRLTILIGSYAQNYYLGDRAKKTLTETVRCYEEYLPEYFPIVHPSPRNQIWMKKNPWFEEETLPRLRGEIGRALGK